MWSTIETMSPNGVPGVLPAAPHLHLMHHNPSKR